MKLKPDETMRYWYGDYRTFFPHVYIHRHYHYLGGERTLNIQWIRWHWGWRLA